MSMFFGARSAFTLRQAQGFTLRQAQGFTLVELLVVIAVLAILAVVLIMVINPVELLRQARDSNRISDLQALNKALSIYDVDQTSGFMGTSTVVYVSIPDSSSTCANLGLPTLPSGYTYACSSSTNYRKVNGTGWVPVDFTDISAGAPISVLPIDPTNTTSTRRYYTYIPGGSWELATSLESNKMKLGGTADSVSKDGGDSTSLYELGTNTSLLPIDYGDSGLVGYWKFDEGSGTTAYDASGNGNHGTWNGSGAHYGAGKVGDYAGQFNVSGAVEDYINATGTILSSGPPFSVIMWARADSLSSPDAPELFRKYTSTALPYLHLRVGYSDQLEFRVKGQSATLIASSPNSSIEVGRWYFIAATYDGSTSAKIYLDGELAGSAVGSPGSYASDYSFAIARGFNGWEWNGLIDDTKVYERALTAAEILAIYNATR